MEKIEIVKIYQKDVVLNIKISKKSSRKISIVGGHIYLTLKENYSLNDVQKMLTRVLTEKKVNALHSSPFITPYYIDVLGVRRRLVIISKGQQRISKEDFVCEKEKDIEKKLKAFELDIIKSRVEKYQKIMGIPISYQVKITNMRAAVGKNYYQKKLLTFDHILIHFSLDIIDSVVIHELSHYFEQNHSNAFYQILLAYQPNYRTLRRKLINGERQWLNLLPVDKTL